MRYGLDELTETLTKAAMAKALEAETARREVLPFLGETFGGDAEALYKEALESCGVDLAGIPPDHYRSMLRLITPEGNLAKPSFAQDSAARKTLAAQCPATSRIRKA
ncbi:hypothetical protein GCM10010909_07710 [Acidocella aquatica]|uniref:Uncharacterized protein n=1 Tax=Acidocella aquatica TaxID=1922313 RepID=A0ABQ6A7B9_9PROT|nr:hypothetical protein [Acidocella aquatica]GLR66093.1 hypothetical protein GCM10010909_07710 [Acidocella aquatica]